mmetsp:Transcript_50184/g.151065  ORF Transcript_50184/g.151065 Transcript_50184/m.151065 type:complete len:142 (-) Transcript_50184:1413-1838(-)
MNLLNIFPSSTPSVTTSTWSRHGCNEHPVGTGSPFPLPQPKCHLQGDQRSGEFSPFTLHELLSRICCRQASIATHQDAQGKHVHSNDEVGSKANPCYSANMIDGVLLGYLSLSGTVGSAKETKVHEMYKSVIYCVSYWHMV